MYLKIMYTQILSWFSHSVVPLQWSWYESHADGSRIALTHWRAAHQLLAKEMPDSSFPWRLGSCEVSPKGCHPPDDDKGLLKLYESCHANWQPGWSVASPELESEFLWSRLGGCSWWRGGKRIIVLQELHSTQEISLVRQVFWGGSLLSPLNYPSPICSKTSAYHARFVVLAVIWPCHVCDLFMSCTLQSSVTDHVTLTKLWWFQVLLPVCRFFGASLLCMPVLPQYCHPFSGAVKWWWEVLGWPQMAP